MFPPGTTNARLVFSSVVILMVMVSIRLGEAKRGCAAFGHSCYGGHGKRSDLPPINPDNSEISYIFKPSSNDIGEILTDEDAEEGSFEVSTGDQQDSRNLAFISPSQYQDSVRFSPLFWKWLMSSSYRDSEGIKK